MTFNPQSNTKFHTVYSLRAKILHIYGNRGMFSIFPHVYGIGSTWQELQQLGVQALPVKAAEQLAFLGRMLMFLGFCQVDLRKFDDIKECVRQTALHSAALAHSSFLVKFWSSLAHFLMGKWWQKPAPFYDYNYNHFIDAHCSCAMLCMYIAHLKTFSFSLSSLLYKVEKFGRIDILINNASALWWQRKQQSVTALCCFSGPN